MKLLCYQKPVIGQENTENGSDLLLAAQGQEEDLNLIKWEFWEWVWKMCPFDFNKRLATGEKRWKNSKGDIWEVPS